MPSNNSYQSVDGINENDEHTDNRVSGSESSIKYLYKINSCWGLSQPGVV